MKKNGKGRYKIYISPQTSCLPGVLGKIAEILGENGAQGFKFGADAYSLLRPDKLVAYFSTFADIEAATDELVRELGELPVHGVPFTAELSGDGLVSWGIDPPRSEHLIGWQERESWRLWVTNRLATPS